MSGQSRQYERYARGAVFLLGTAIAGASVLTGFPFAPFFDDTATLRAGFRFAFGSIFLASLLRSRTALPIIYGHTQLHKDGLKLRSSFYLQIPVTVAIVFGVLTEIAAIILFLLRAYFLVRTKRWGLENNIYQTTLVTLPFLGLGQAYSVDQIIGFPMLLTSPLVFNAQFVLYGVMMLSGGYHKLTNDMWQRGNAVKYFLTAPHLQTRFGSFVTKFLSTPIFRVLNYVTLFAELLLLFSVFNRYLLVGTLIVLAGFAVSAFTLVDLSYIGQSLLTVLCLYLFTLLVNFGAYPTIAMLFTPKISLLSAVFAGLVGLALIETFWPKVGSNPRVRLPATALTGMNTPIKPFNEHHLIGVYTFRFRTVADDGTMTPVLPVFEEDGRPGPFQRLYPRYYQASMYQVTDYCLGLINGCPDPEARAAIEDLCVCALDSAGQETGTVEVAVRLLDARDPSGYLSNDWKTVCHCTVTENDIEWEQRQQPPIPEETYRAQLEPAFRRAR